MHYSVYLTNFTPRRAHETFPLSIERVFFGPRMDGSGKDA
jgi:hypothetical protein